MNISKFQDPIGARPCPRKSYLLESKKMDYEKEREKERKKEIYMEEQSQYPLFLLFFFPLKF